VRVAERAWKITSGSPSVTQGVASIESHSSATLEWSAAGIRKHKGIVLNFSETQL
jgi:hypothetical protein